jgi:hypothetical protein
MDIRRKDPSYWHRVERSKQMTAEQRFYGTLEMIDLSWELMTAGIRMQFPDANDEQIPSLIRERIRVGKAVEMRS